MPTRTDTLTSLDVLLAIMYAPVIGVTAGVMKGTTRLQKLLFLLYKEGGFSESIPDLYGFKAYDFGPCLDDIYDDIAFAKEIGLLDEKEIKGVSMYEEYDENSFLNEFGRTKPKSSVRRDYSLTKVGLEAAKEAFENLSSVEQASMTRIKATFGTIPLLNLLRYVYKKYPTFAEKSILDL